MTATFVRVRWCGAVCLLMALPIEPASASQIRRYFVAADEVSWDYAPSGLNQITGKPFSGLETELTDRSATRLGRVFKKAIYREYTDETFAALKPRPAEWEHLGMLGPLIRAEVGDTIRILFQNHTSRPVSMHPHGVFYTKSSEGAPYADGTTGSDRQDDAVPPGASHTYVWEVPERAGPSEHEGSSALWMYHSHTSETADVNAGLIGPMIVTRRGSARPDGAPTDVDREIVAAFMEMDENLSSYYDQNVAAALEPEKIPRGVDFADPYYGSNLKETINGLFFGNTPAMTMRVGERVRWYLFGSTNFEIHAPHWHGNTVIAMHMRNDVVSLLPMGMVIADMVPDDPGTWLFHCHVGPHLDAGMITRYTVLPAAK